MCRNWGLLRNMEVLAARKVRKRGLPLYGFFYSDQFFVLVLVAAIAFIGLLMWGIG